MLNKYFSYLPVVAVVLVASGLSLPGQEVPEMNARDMFYSAADMLGKKQSPTQPPPKKSSTKTTSTPTGKPKPQPELAHVAVPKNPEAYFQQAAAQKDLPLGIRYSIMKKTAEGLVEVKPDSVFHAGDRIRISAMGNQKSYLYVVARGTSGLWSPLFPNEKSTQQQNEIVPGRKYQVPGGEDEYFEFDRQAGNEKVFILLSRQPVKDLDSLILSLTNEKSAAVSMTADSRINDQLVDRLRSEIGSRDLVFTRADKEPKESQEQAVYVVNNAKTAQQSESRVVVDLTLNHQP